MQCNESDSSVLWHSIRCNHTASEKKPFERKEVIENGNCCKSSSKLFSAEYIDTAIGLLPPFRMSSDKKDKRFSNASHYSFLTMIVNSGTERLRNTQLLKRRGGYGYLEVCMKIVFFA